MKLLHTADWHIGQLFHEYDRTFEHSQFLNWLVTILKDEQVEVLLITGDVFDLSNPSATSVKLFYTFLSEVSGANPHLQVIITAGNHDSALRLESPKPLLKASNIHIVGLVERDAEGKIDYSKLVIPVSDSCGAIMAWCMAIPFLRMGDYPVIADCSNPYAEGVATLYKEAYEYALGKKAPGQAIIAMGHLHAQHAEVTDMDKSERQIMGGVECISATAFHRDINYVALGHIHKAQRIGGREHIRYCGSPLPMSFSEVNYRHQVLLFELHSGSMLDMKSIEVPISVPLQIIPRRHAILEEVLPALRQLPDSNPDSGVAPYLEVRVLQDGPEPALRHKIETALAGKHARLARINVTYPNASVTENNADLIRKDKLHELQPSDVFSTVYQEKYHSRVPENLMQLFNEVVQQVSQEK